MKKLIALTAAAMFLTTAVTAPALARRCESVNAPDTVDVGGTTLQLNGLGIREATMLQVNVYVAALYVEQTSRDANAILGSDTKKRIVLHFVREVERAKIEEAFREGFQHNAPGTPRAKIDRLIGWVTDMREGQTMTFTYIPGTGTEFRVNNQVKGTIDGADFGRAVFSLFIGPRPPNPGLRSGLLGGRCG